MGTHTPDIRASDAHAGPRVATRVSLTAILGMPVTDARGHLCGKLSDVAITTGPDGGKVAGLVLKTRTGLSLVPSQ
jgi:sporulation protein YlmC with PRC-barrel domain